MVGLNSGICIESQYSDLLNKVVSVMVNRDFTLKTIDNYVTQIEGFLEKMGADEMDYVDMRSYLNAIKSDSSFQAIHFFFKEVLGPQKQDPNKPKPAPKAVLCADGLYRQIAI